PGARTPPPTSPASAEVSWSMTPPGANVEPHHHPPARPHRTRGGYRPRSCAGSGLCRSTALGAKAESNHTPPSPPPFAPGAGAPTVRPPAPAPVSCRSTAHGAKAEPNPNHRAYTLRTRGGCSYNKLVEVLGGVPFGHLFVQLAPGTVDLAAALYCGPYGDLLGPAHEVGIALRIEEFGGAVHLVGHYAAIPGPDGHVGDAVLVPGDIGVVGQLPIEYVQLTLGFHGVAVDRVLVLLRRVGVEVTEAAADEGRTAHLPEQPVEALGTTTDVLRNEGAELVRQIQQDGAGLEQPQRRVHAG